jgi:tetratricopeptide (TPR) repeat protein
MKKIRLPIIPVIVAALMCLWAYGTVAYAAADIKALKTKIEGAWDSGDFMAFENQEMELTSQVSDKDADGCLVLAKFYYRYSLLCEEKANTDKKHWLDGEKYAGDKAQWAKGGDMIDKAVEYVMKADEMSPENPKILPSYALIKYRKIRHCGNMACALLHMKSLLDITRLTIEKGENDADANLSYGIYMLSRSPKMGGNPREAINYLQRAIELDPNRAEGYFWCGKFFMSPNIKFQPKLARPNFEKAVALNPKNWLYKETLDELNKEYPPEK